MRNLVLRNGEGFTATMGDDGLWIIKKHGRLMMRWLNFRERFMHGVHWAILFWVGFWFGFALGLCVAALWVAQ